MAEAALVRAFASVCSFVIPKCARVGELLLTCRTSVRLFAGVNSHVSLQCRQSFKLHAADLTAELRLTDVQLNMLL